MNREPCLCGDPECRRCFPGGWGDEDPDEAYDIQQQKELDDEPGRTA